MWSMRSVAGLLFALASLSSPPVWSAPHEPARGSAERSAILDAVRPAIEGVLGAPLEFVVTVMRVDEDFAFLQLEPQRPGGEEIDPATLGLNVEMMDGLTIFALVKLESGGWTLIESEVGPTDVVWWGWWDTYGAPRGIFPE